MLRVSINGRPAECQPGATVLQALRSAGADVPSLCDDERLGPVGACRLCLVHVAGRPKPVTACNTPVTDGMDVQTHTPDVERARRTTLRLLAGHYPPGPQRRFPGKPFHQYLRAYGLEGELRGIADRGLVDDSHPYIHVDMSQCVLCFRCVRICEEVQGQEVWRAWGRGDRTRIRPGSGANLMDSDCVGCGACADTCPTGAIEDREMFEHGGGNPGVERWTRTTCPYCGTGCEMSVGTKHGRIVSVRPVRGAPVSRGHLCVKGRYAHGFNDAPDRVTDPMIREGGRWRKASWDEAVGFVAGGMRRAVERYGPDAVGVLGSARATNEENYLAQKFARVVLGTNNVDCCARVCHAPTAAGMQQMLGTGAATNSFDDIERSAAILVCGANPTENHPVVGARIAQSARRGAALVAIDPRRTELARLADCHLRLRPGTNVPLLNAMACTIVEERLCDDAFVRDRVDDLGAFAAFVAAWRPEAVAGLCGVEAPLIRRAARLYATRKPAMCFHGLGVTEQLQGTEAVQCLVNLALLTGNLGKPGSGINPLRGQNNVQGAAHMGCEPGCLPGFVPLGQGHELVESAWGTPLPARPGLNLMRMIDAAGAGRLKALWAIGYDVALTNPNAQATRQALRSLDLLVVQDLFVNRTAELATAFLPAASPFEKDGTFMNAERRVQRVRKALEPAGRSRPDWQIVCDVAAAMGHGARFAFQSPQEVWDEVRAVWTAGRGITYERLEGGGLQWPCPSADHPGTPVLHVDSFPAGTRAALRRIAFTPTGEEASDDYPFLLTTGRTLYQFNSGTMTGRTPNAGLRPGNRLDMAPQDAARLGVGNGERVRVRSRYGAVDIAVRICPTAKPGELFATFHDPQAVVNEVTGANRDRFTDTPAYKVTSVRVGKL